MEEEWDNTKMDILNYLGCTDARDIDEDQTLPNVSILNYPKYVSDQAQTRLYEQSRIAQESDNSHLI